MAVTISRDQRQNVATAKGTVEVITFTWTSDGSGDASTTVPLDGWLIKAITNPDGSAAPTDNYDITLVDENSLDAAESLLINRDTANTEVVYMLVAAAATPIFLSGTHTFTVANAGDTKEGVCKLYMVSDI